MPYKQDVVVGTNIVKLPVTNIIWSDNSFTAGLSYMERKYFLLNKSIKELSSNYGGNLPDKLEPILDVENGFPLVIDYFIKGNKVTIIEYTRELTVILLDIITVKCLPDIISSYIVE